MFSFEAMNGSTRAQGGGDLKSNEDAASVSQDQQNLSHRTGAQRKTVGEQWVQPPMLFQLGLAEPCLR